MVPSYHNNSWITAQISKLAFSRFAVQLRTAPWLYMWACHRNRMTRSSWEPTSVSSYFFCCFMSMGNDILRQTTTWLPLEGVRWHIRLIIHIVLAQVTFIGMSANRNSWITFFHQGEHFAGASSHLWFPHGGLHVFQFEHDFVWEQVSARAHTHHTTHTYTHTNKHVVVGLIVLNLLSLFFCVGLQLCWHIKLSEQPCHSMRNNLEVQQRSWIRSNCDPLQTKRDHGTSIAGKSSLTHCDVCDELLHAFSTLSNWAWVMAIRTVLCCTTSNSRFRQASEQDVSLRLNFIYSPTFSSDVIVCHSHLISLCRHHSTPPTHPP